MDIIEKIQEIMSREGVTRYRLSKQTGISDVLLKKYFSKQVTPSISQIEKILHALNYVLKVEKYNSIPDPI